MNLHVHEKGLKRAMHPDVEAIMWKKKVLLLKELLTEAGYKVMRCSRTWSKGSS